MNQLYKILLECCTHVQVHPKKSARFHRHHSQMTAPLLHTNLEKKINSFVNTEGISEKKHQVT